ncbi:Aldo/keto reductase [Mycena polygramma]|nr:Aldo/keto reductase [Mycena polygramma]
MSSTLTQTSTRRVKYGNSKLFVPALVFTPCSSPRKLGPKGLPNHPRLMSYGSKEWSPWVLEEEEAIKNIKFARSIPPTYVMSACVLLISTGPKVYSNGLSEIILGNAIKKLQLPREEIVVLGAVGKTVGTDSMELYLAGPDNLGYVNQHGLSRKHIFASVKASLARLQLDYIDVLQCHRFDADTPVAETMQALHDVVQAGLCATSASLRATHGSSGIACKVTIVSTGILLDLITCHTDYAISHNLTPFISMQNQYSLVYREEEHEMMPLLKAEKSVRQETDVFPPDAYFTQGAGNKDVVARDRKEAQQNDGTGLGLPRVAHGERGGNCTDHRDYVSRKTRRPHRCAAPLIYCALEAKLSAEDIKYLEELYKPMNIMYFWIQQEPA